MSRLLSVVLFAASLILVGACAETVSKPGPTPIGMGSGKITLEKVTEAIQKAAPKAKWTATVIRPGLIEAKRAWGGGKHSIVVEVVYNTKDFEINPKSSKNLRRSDGSVHPAFNFQIGELRRAIKSTTWSM